MAAHLPEKAKEERVWSDISNRLINNNTEAWGHLTEFAKDFAKSDGAFKVTSRDRQYDGF